jgi:hypothetical protein
MLGSLGILIANLVQNMKLLYPIFNSNLLGFELCSPSQQAKYFSNWAQ